MARKLSDKPNVIAPVAPYPYGRIKDDTGSNNGTPVDEEVYGDLHQFFERMMALASVTFNGNPENSTDGFQYNIAFEKLVRMFQASYTEKGVAMFSTLGEMVALSSFSPEDKMVNPRTLYLSSKIAHTESRLTTKIVDIGDWNMQANATKNVAHGVNVELIRDVKAMIFSDTGSTEIFPLDSYNAVTFNIDGGVCYIDPIHVELRRRPSGYFDTADFNATSYNRGFILITYAG